MNEPTTTLFGNLAADPELRFTPSGVAVCKLRMAMTPRFKSGDEWKDGEPFWQDVTVWNETAEHVAESLTKGDRVIVFGRLKQRTVEKDGQKRTFWDLEADAIGPELRYATAKVTRVSKGGNGGGNQGGDGWASASKERPAKAAANADQSRASAAPDPSNDW